MSRKIELYRGHCVDLFRKHAGPFDLLAVDPPYALGGEGAEHAVAAAVAVGLREAGHRLAKDRWAVVFAAASWRSTFYMVEALRGVLEPVRIGTWVKPAARSKARTPGWAWASVNVLVFKKGRPQGEAGTALDWIESPPMMRGRRAELPDAVADWAVSPFAVPGGLCLDPFAGSGALLAAAVRADMRAIGFEQSEPEPQSRLPLWGDSP